MTAFLDVWEKHETQILPFEQSLAERESPLPAIYTKGQLWGALRKTWKAYKISKAQGNHLAMMKYGERIRSLQTKLGLELSKFSEVGLG
ncbi:MAG: hypothetical protein ACRECH_01925 [Nitrososphaerales archaeon]